MGKTLVLRHFCKQGLEIAGHPLTLMINVRKFRCRNTACQRKVFSAPLSPLASSHARNTRKVEERIRSISLKTTSRIAGNLLHEQNIVCSQSSCLRCANVRILVADSIGLQSLSLRNKGCKSSICEIYTLYYTQECKIGCFCIF